jgi:hypothetical protein
MAKQEPNQIKASFVKACRFCFFTDHIYKKNLNIHKPNLTKTKQMPFIKQTRDNL